MGANSCLHLLVTMKVILELRDVWTGAERAADASVARATRVRRMATMVEVLCGVASAR